MEYQRNEKIAINRLYAFRKVYFVIKRLLNGEKLFLKKKYDAGDAQPGRAAVSNWDLENCRPQGHVGSNPAAGVKLF